MDAEAIESTLERALTGDRIARSRLVDQLTPVIHKRVARVLLRHGAARGRAIRQDVEDLVQTVWVHLISKDYKVLRDWKRERGLSLRNFVGLVADRRTMRALQSRIQNPYTEEPMPIEEFDDPDDEPNPEVQATSQDLLRKVLDRLKQEVSALGYFVFTLLFIHQLQPEEAAKTSGLTVAAVYKWRERLRKIVRRILDELSKSPPPGQST